MVTDKPEPAFEDLAATALANADIDTPLRAARAAAEAAAAAQTQASNSPHLEADPDKIVYEITVELRDAGLLPGLIPHELDKPTKPVVLHAKEDTTTDTSRRYLT